MDYTKLGVNVISYEVAVAVQDGVIRLDLTRLLKFLLANYLSDYSVRNRILPGFNMSWTESMQTDYILKRFGTLAAFLFALSYVIDDERSDLMRILIESAVVAGGEAAYNMYYRPPVATS